MSLVSMVENNYDLQKIVRILHDHQGHCYLVGGCVRDHFLGISSHNFDLEVFNLSSKAIIDYLKPHYDINIVGKSYGILKIHGPDIDIGVPRQEEKSGLAHTDFVVHENPSLPIEEAIRRRDFTINAIYFDLKTQQIIDPFRGIDDLNNRILRHVSERFAEDPLRVLRGMQFCARFELTPHPKTIEYCKTLSAEHLSHERIFQEFVKLLINGVKPSLGLKFLKDTEWTQFFPELHALIGVEQDPKRHPEGDVFQHTSQCLDTFASHKPGIFEDDLILALALLCHDFGKPAKTFKDHRGIHSYGHEIAGVLPARNFMEQLRVPKNIMPQALTLIQYHVEPRRFFKRQASDADFRRLSYNVHRLDLLALLGYCDCAGRINNNKEIYEWIIKKAKKLNILKAPPKAIIQGRHLIGLGMQSHKDFSKILLDTYFAQLQGDFSTLEEGLHFVQKMFLPRKCS